jgi:microsomal dipeptidase-like Zn-dependent dipeptidase
MRGRLLAAALVLAILLALALAVGPGLVEARFNRVQGAPAAVTPAAAALHGRLLVADLHSDALLWGRNLLQRSTRGHVDLPRLREGHVALQAFTVVTKVPHGLSATRNAADTSDDITALALLQRWPPATVTSLTARALYQAGRLRDMAARSEDGLVLLRTRADVKALLERRAREPRVVGAWLGLEGAHALQGDLANVDALDAAGYRMIGLAHFFDNEWAGSAHGVKKGGLTDLGRKLVPELERRRILLDLAHASPAAVDEALALSRRPVVVSHTGVKGTCDNVRNLDDEELRGVARTGGLVGIGYWQTAVCGTDGRAIARAIRHAVRVAGIDHVALGSDFDGAVAEPFDTTGLAEVTDALLAEGFSEAEVAQIMGGNALRLLAATLP